MRLHRATALLLLLVLTVGCAAGPSTKEIRSRTPDFANAVYVGSSIGLREAADPAPLKFNGQYYVYVTGSPCRVLRSDDLVNWTYVGDMITERNGSCWAPDVVYKNGLFYAYISTLTQPHIEGSRRVKLYTSPTPEGPFIFEAVLTEHYSYDPDYFMDEAGNEYLYWTQECATMREVDPCTGNANVGDRLIGMTRLAGELTRVMHPEGWECRYRCIHEAPATLERDGQFFMQYSGAAYENYSYGGGYLRSTTPLGPGGPTDTSWVREERRILQTVEGKVDGPGGAAWIKGPNGLDDWTIYHGRGITREDWDRWLRIDPVMWGRDRFWLPGAPSFDPLHGPAMPQFRDLFSTGITLSKAWQTTGGTWQIVDGAARQAEVQSGAARALVTAVAPAEHYVYEANLRFLTEGGTAGVYAFWADEQNHLAAMVDRAAGLLLLGTTVGGTAHPLQALKLPADIDWTTWQQLVLRKNGSRFAFWLNGRALGTVEVPLLGAGWVGLAAQDAAAEFDGIAFTHGWEDFFDQPEHGWTAQGGEWQVEQSELRQGSGQGRAAALKGARDWGSYEFTASLRAEGPGGGAIGLYAGYWDEKHYVEVLLDQQAGTFTTRSVVKEKEELVTTPLPKGSDLTRWQTVQVTKNGFAFRFWLNGELVQERSVSLAQGQPGLLTVDSAARFDSVRAVRWD